MWCVRSIKIQCVRLSYSIDIFYYITFTQKKLHFERNYAVTLDVSCGMISNIIISNVINLNYGVNDTDLENVSLIWRSISDGQKTCSSKDASLIGTC